MASRREFVKSISSATACLACGVGIASLLESCTSIQYVSGDLVENKMRVSKAQFGENKFVILSNTKLPVPIYLVKLKEEFLAHSIYCTHKGCELKPTGTFLTCPCHGAEFSSKGEVLNGPADRPLDGYKITETETELIIDISKSI